MFQNARNMIGLCKKYCSTVMAATWLLSAGFDCSQVCAAKGEASFGPEMEAIRHPS